VKKQKMNTKVIVALVVGIVLVGLTGAASADIYSFTDITGNRFMSTSSTAVSGIPVEENYAMVLMAEFKEPIFPQYDVSSTQYSLEGVDYSTNNDIYSSPSGSATSTTIDSPADVSGTLSYWNCVLWGIGEDARAIDFPQDITEPDTGGWMSSHLAGSTYPGSFSESYQIYWP